MAQLQLQGTTLALILLQLCLLCLGQDQQVPSLICVQANNNATPSSTCKTLDWYSNHSARIFTSNAKFEFQNGTHLLKKFLHISNCHNLTMEGDGNTQDDGNGLPQPTAIINCSGKHASAIMIANSSNIFIRNLEFRHCSGHYTIRKRYHFVGSLVFLYVQNIHLTKVVVNKTMGYGLHATNVHGNNTIVESAFLYASQHYDPRLKHSGNANFYFDKDVMNTSLVVDSSWFMYGNNHDETSGLKLTIHRTNIRVSLFNVTAQGNTGHYGGNVAISVSETNNCNNYIDQKVSNCRWESI